MVKKNNNRSLMFPTERNGICRICGEHTRLSKEHIIPRKAGGGVRTKLYDPVDILQNEKDPSKAYGSIMQSGLAGYTLCEKCNNASGHFYDDAFSDFINDFNGCIHGCKTEKGLNYEDIRNKNIIIRYKTPHKIKPLNIAKRVLVSFCSNERRNIISKDFPEIRKAIMEYKYKPDTNGFRIFFSALIGGDGEFFSGIVMFHKKLGIIELSGIEYRHTGFYFTTQECKMPETMLDITNWLTDYDYDQEVDACFTMPLAYTHGVPTPPIEH